MSSLPVSKRAEKIEDDCERAAIRDALVSSRWNRYNLYLGLASAIAAAVAAFVAGNGPESLDFLKAIHLVGSEFSSDKSVIALFALISAVLTSVLTFLRPSKIAESFQESSNRYHALREQLREFCSRPDVQGDQESASTDLQAFIEQKRDVDASHPIVPEWAYDKAHWRIERKKIRKHELKRIDRFLKDNPDYEIPRTWRERMRRCLAGVALPPLKSQSPPDNRPNETT